MSSNKHTGAKGKAVFDRHDGRVELAGQISRLQDYAKSINALPNNWYPLSFNDLVTKPLPVLRVLLCTVSEFTSNHDDCW